MLREDQVFATKLALAGPWGHISEVLGGRNWSLERHSAVARKLGVPAWHRHFATALQCREMLRWLGECNLDEQQRSRARSAVARMYVRRQQTVLAHRSRRLLREARELVDRR